MCIDIKQLDVQGTRLTFYIYYNVVSPLKDPATRNDFVNDIVNDARADAIFATLKAIVDDEKSTISSTISLRVAWPLDGEQFRYVSTYHYQY